MEFLCKRCGVAFATKATLIKHLNRKTVCKPIEADIDVSDLLNELQRQYKDNAHCCITCNKKFNTKQSMYRHRKICIKNQDDASKNDENTQLAPTNTSDVTELQKQVAFLQDTLDLLMLEIRNKPNITSNNYTTNNVLVLNNLGEESIQHLTDQFLLEVFKDKDPAYLAQQIHFSREVPENQNLRLRDDTTIEIFRNNKWIPQDIDMTLTDLIQSDWRFLRVRCTTMKRKVVLEKKINLEDYDNTLEWWENMCRNAKMQEDFKEDILVTMRDDIEFKDD